MNPIFHMWAKHSLYKNGVGWVDFSNLIIDITETSLSILVTSNDEFQVGDELFIRDNKYGTRHIIITNIPFKELYSDDWYSEWIIEFKEIR